jgi:hypothetical protein
MRSCYHSSMRLYNDNPGVLTPGRWRFCPPGAILAPATVFNSRRWSLEDDTDYPLGEVYQTHYRYSRGESDPRLTGLHYCGGSAWTQGITYASRPGLVVDATGTPLCCQALPPRPGGVRIGGRGTWPGVVTPIYGGSFCQCETVLGPATTV